MGLHLINIGPQEKHNAFQQCEHSRTAAAGPIDRD